MKLTYDVIILAGPELKRPRAGGDFLEEEGVFFLLFGVRTRDQPPPATSVAVVIPVEVDQVYFVVQIRVFVRFERAYNVQFVVDVDFD